jgi:hypothetical protein
MAAAEAALIGGSGGFFVAPCACANAGLAARRLNACLRRIEQLHDKTDLAQDYSDAHRSALTMRRWRFVWCG